MAGFPKINFSFCDVFDIDLTLDTYDYHRIAHGFSLKNVNR